ncbi:hypothetical protein [Reyranella soli]|uniref:hypothetical protein n=1 Tax=Reyranella soli TaxID=1230389 RepID=UPI001FE961BF|nr:hypothetical protein [Reyranella soli]
MRTITGDRVCVENAVYLLSEEAFQLRLGRSKSGSCCAELLAIEEQEMKAKKTADWFCPRPSPPAGS